MNKNSVFYSILILLLLASIGGNIAFGSYISSNFGKKKSSEEIVPKYDYLSSVVQSETPSKIIINLNDLRNKLNSYVENSNSDIGMYFEYLPSGMTIGINEKQSFFQASLVKVPMAMYLYKGIELGKIKPTDELIITEEAKDEDFGNLWQKETGTKLTIETLIDEMLINSDNTAYRVLWNKYPEFLDEIFDNLDLPKDSEQGDPVVTPKNYSSVFKALYLSSYNSPYYSNEILTLLTGSPFDTWLAGGIPKNTPISHKIGVRAGEKVYSDCGIVYVPNRPYSVCVFIKGTPEEADEHIPAISKIIYDFVSTY